MDVRNKLTPSTNKTPFFFKFLFGYIIFSLLVLVFFVGYFVGLARPGTFSSSEILSQIVERAPQYVKDKNIDFNQFWEVWQYLGNEYVHQPIDETTAFYGALKGLVASLDDPYSVYFDPQEAKEFDVEISGQFEGIGAEIGIKDEKLVVISPMPGSPSEEAGLKAGDQIIKIDETDAYNLTVDQAIQLIRGEKGTRVTLLIVHEGESEPVAISIARDTITTESVSWKMLDSKLAYVAITSFSNDTVTQFNKAITEILLEEPKGLILDLRNNPGGYLDVAVKVAGEFIEDDLVVTEKMSGDRRQEHFSDGTSRLKSVPTVILVNPGTASAAEILAGALQDYHLATLVGETTFGKGTVQDYTEFDDGSSLKVSVAEWLTPSGRSIDKKGITPDVAVKYTLEQYQAGVDPQLEAAIKQLTQTP
ncbi:MAG: S41 family peptidase [Patescibacteria group bacterium]|nr:S41 family peptidase [Patescibacteria group bacterium]